MTKQEFLQHLKVHLQPLPAAEREDILADFEEHFQAGAESGKTEEQICAELGNPYTCALQYLRSAPTYAPNANAQAANPVPPAAPVQPSPVNPVQQAKERNDTRLNRTLWAIFFFVLVFVAIGAYPTFAALMLSPFIVLIVAIFAVAAVPTGLMVAFLISLSVFLFVAGLQGIIELTWLLKYSYRRAGF